MIPIAQNRRNRRAPTRSTSRLSAAGTAIAFTTSGRETMSMNFR